LFDDADLTASLVGTTTTEDLSHTPFRSIGGRRDAHGAGRRHRRAQPFEVTLQGIRSMMAVLYAASTPWVVSGGGANLRRVGAVSYIETVPDRIGLHCDRSHRQDSTLATGGSVVLRIPWIRPRLP